MQSFYGQLQRFTCYGKQVQAKTKKISGTMERATKNWTL